MEVSHEVDIADPGNRCHVTMRVLHATMQGNNVAECNNARQQLIWK